MARMALAVSSRRAPVATSPESPDFRLLQYFFVGLINIVRSTIKSKGALPDIHLGEAVNYT
jgi:hypothetical protein